jgi:hypothetical protein
MKGSVVTAVFVTKLPWWLWWSIFAPACKTWDDRAANRPIMISPMTISSISFSSQQLHFGRTIVSSGFASPFAYSAPSHISCIFQSIFLLALYKFVPPSPKKISSLSHRARSKFITEVSPFKKKNVHYQGKGQ